MRVVSCPYQIPPVPNDVVTEIVDGHPAGARVAHLEDDLLDSVVPGYPGGEFRDGGRE